MWTLTAVAALTLLPLQDPAAAREAVVRAALDYAEAFSERDPTRIERSVSRKFFEMAYSQLNEEDWVGLPIFYPDLHAAAVRASQKEEQPPPGPAPVEVLDLRSHTALVKLTHDRRVSYQQICREGDTWRVRHALSRSAPTETTGEIAESDRTALEQAANDYVEGFYRAAPERIDRSVDRVMLKFGYWREEGTESWQPLMHDFNGLREMAATWNSKGWLPDDAPREVEVLDVMGKLAAVRLTAWWGVDTLLCVRQDDGSWHIQLVLWQSK